MARHFDEVGFADVQLGGKQLRCGIEPRGEQLLTLPFQTKKQFSAGARVADVDEARVGHEEAQDVGANPVRGVRAEARTHLGIPTPDRLHQANRTFLKQVEDVEPGLPVLVGDGDHQSQVVHHKPTGGVEVAALARSVPERSFFVLFEARVTAGLLDEAPHRIADGDEALFRLGQDAFKRGFLDGRWLGGVGEEIFFAGFLVGIRARGLRGARGWRRGDRFLTARSLHGS